MRKTGVFNRFKTKAKAHMAAMRHGRPARKMRVVLVVGQDGAAGTVAYLTSILKTTGVRVGVITQSYVEIAGERGSGSDQADVLGDAHRLQGLLAQMRKARCKYGVIEVPSELPEHHFMGVQPQMVVIRRCGDDYTDQVVLAARLAMLRNLLERQPEFVVFNRDDPSAGELNYLAGKEGVMSFGVHAKAETRMTDVTLHPKGSAVELLVDHQTEMKVATVMTGKRAIYNATAAAAAAYLLHTSIEVIEKGIRETPELPGQMEYMAANRPYQIVLDAATTPGGIAETLETLKHFTKNRLIVLLGAPLGIAPSLPPVLGEVAARHADRLVITDGEYTSEQSPQQLRESLLQGVIAAGGEAKTDEVADRQAGIEKVISIARRGDIVMVAATPQHLYRQLGPDRVTWSDRKKIEELLEP